MWRTLCLSDWPRNLGNVSEYTGEVLDKLGLCNNVHTLREGQLGVSVSEIFKDWPDVRPKEQTKFRDAEDLKQALLSSSAIPCCAPAMYHNGLWTTDGAVSLSQVQSVFTDNDYTLMISPSNLWWARGVKKSILKPSKSISSYDGAKPVVPQGMD